MWPVHAFHSLPLLESQGSPGLGWAGRGLHLPWEPRGKAERSWGQRAGRGRRSLQFISSEASSQSTNWLQRLEFPMQVPSRQRNSPAPQAVSTTVPAPCHQPGPPRGGHAGPGQDLPAQSACPGPLYRTLNQNPWDLGTIAQRGRGWGGAAGGRGGLRPGLGPTHCYRESHPSRPRSRPPRCTTACWTHSARCCTGGRSSCSGGCLQVGAGRSEQRLGAASDETLLRAWHGSHGGSPLHKLRTFSRGCREGGGFAPLTPMPHPVGTEAGDSESGGLGVRVGALTAVGRLLVRLVLAVGDAVACQAKIDALAVGTLELVLCTARGIHRWGERRGAS